MTKNSYAKKLKDPRWQKKKLLILERDEWTCRLCNCKTETLNVHHCFYERGRDPWDYPDESLVTLCEHCHGDEAENKKEAICNLLYEFDRHGWVSGDINNIVDGFHMSKALSNKKYRWSRSDVVQYVIMVDEWAALIYTLLDDCSSGQYKFSRFIFNCPEFKEYSPVHPS